MQSKKEKLEMASRIVNDTAGVLKYAVNYLYEVAKTTEDTDEKARDMAEKAMEEAFRVVREGVFEGANSATAEDN